VIHLYDAVITISIVLSKIADNPPVSPQLFDSYLDFFTESLTRIGITLKPHPVDALYKDADTNIRYAAMLYYTNPENHCMDKIDLHEITKLTRVQATPRHTDSFLYLEDVVHIKTPNKKVKYDCDGLHLTESRAWISELTREDFVAQYKYFRQVLYRYYQVMSKK
jgi:hypothetical protein